MTYDWEPYKDTCYRLYIEEKKSLRQVHEFLRENHNFTASLRGLHHRLQQWNFPTKRNPAYKNEALISRIKELWETNHQARDMIAILHEEGFDVQERDVNRIRQKNGWLLRLDAVHLKKKLAASTSPGASPGADADHEDAEEEDGGGRELSAAPDLSNIMPGTLPNVDLNQAQAEAFQEARRRAIAAEAAERRATKRRRRWLKGRAGLPADPPGPPRFPSELSLTECKGVLSLDASNYKDIRARFRDICEREGVVKKTIAGPHKWEEIKLQLVRGNMHLRAVFWEDSNVDQKNLALDLICCDVTKNIRSGGSRMMLHEARNLLGLNPESGRNVRFHFQKILHQDHFAGKIVAGEEHWTELVQRWLSESNVLQPVAESLSSLDPDTARRTQKAIEAVARDAMKRFRDAEARGTLAKMMEYELNAQDDQQDAQGETEHDAGANGTAIDMTGFNDGSFEAEQAAQIAAQLTMEAADCPNYASSAAAPADGQTLPSSSAMPAHDHTPPETNAPPKRKRGRPRKLAHPDSSAQPTTGEPLAKKRRGRQSKRIPQEEALRVYEHSQARFLPPDTPAGQLSSVSTEPGALSSFTTPSQPVVADRQQCTSIATPVPVGAPATLSSPSQAGASASSSMSTQPSPTAIYFRLHPTSTVTGVPSLRVGTLATRSIDELRSKAVAKTPGARCAFIDGIVKDGMGGEIPLRILSDTELGAYLDHMQEVHGAPRFSVQLFEAR